MKKILFAVAAMSASSVIFAADLKAGKARYSTTCVACHGAKAEGVAGLGVKLAGQSVKQLEQHLLDFKAGKRTGPQAPIMTPTAITLSADDIKNVSAYIAKTFK